MINLYFGNMAAAVTALLLISLIAWIVFVAGHRKEIAFWGRRNLFLAAYGLLICCFAAARDGLDKTIQYAIDGSCAPGIFSLVSLPNLIGCIGAALIVIAGVITLFTRSQNVRQCMFYLMSGGVILKIAVIESSRILLLFE